MPQAVHVAQASNLALTVIEVTLLDVRPVRGDQRAGAGQGIGTVEHGSLLGRGDRNAPLPSALGPGGLESDVVAVVGIAGLELDGFLAAQAEGGLQFQAHAHMRICDGIEPVVQFARLVLTADVAALRDPQLRVVGG